MSIVAPGEFRLRVRYRKSGRLRFLAHLEVVHAIERGARRADLPYAVTQGFSPHMKVSFGPALPVGTAGLNEYVDVWLRAYVPAEEVRDRFAAAMPGDLAPLEARYVSERLPSLSAACTVAEYEVVLGERGRGYQGLEEALGAVVRSGELSVQHKGKTKVFDLTRSIPKEPRVRSTESGIVVDVTTRMGEQGSLRPEMLLEEALSRIDAQDASIEVTRVDTLVEEDGVTKRPI